MRLLHALIPAILLVAGCQPPEPPPYVATSQPAQPPQQGATELEHQKMMCKETLPAKLEAFERMMKGKSYDEAARVLRPCGVMLDDPKLNAMVDAAEYQTHKRAMLDPKANADDAASAADWLKENRPKEAKAIEKLREQALAREEKAKNAAKRKAGVYVGMSREDVLASSWGRPQHVNRTTTSTGTHEQWVYGGMNFLYFDDGVLTAIQN